MGLQSDVAAGRAVRGWRGRGRDTRARLPLRGPLPTPATKPHNPPYVRRCTYEDDLFANFTVSAINEHDPATPLFVYYAPVSTTPL